MGRIPDFTVRENLWDSVSKIGTVYKRRHTMIFPGRDEETSLTFCNNCGSAFCHMDCEIKEK